MSSTPTSGIFYHKNKTIFWAINLTPEEVKTLRLGNYSYCQLFDEGVGPEQLFLRYYRDADSLPSTREISPRWLPSLRDIIFITPCPSFFQQSNEYGEICP